MAQPTNVVMIIDSIEARERSARLILEAKENCATPESEEKISEGKKYQNCSNIRDVR